MPRAGSALDCLSRALHCCQDVGRAGRKPASTRASGAGADPPIGATSPTRAIAAGTCPPPCKRLRTLMLTCAAPRAPLRVQRRRPVLVDLEARGCCDRKSRGGLWTGLYGPFPHGWQGFPRFGFERGGHRRVRRRPEPGSGIGRRELEIEPRGKVNSSERGPRRAARTGLAWVVDLGRASEAWARFH